MRCSFFSATEERSSKRLSVFQTKTFNVVLYLLFCVENSTQKSEAKIQVAGAEIFAAAESENMYVAIDLMTDKLDRQLIKFKEKTRGH